MVAIVVDALRAVPRSWTEGAAALGVNRWRVMWTISVRAARPGDRRRGGAGHGARAGRGDHALDGLRLGGLRAEPDRRPHLPLRADAAARRDDRRQRRGAVGQARSAQTLYAFAAVLLVSSDVPLARRLGAKQPMRKATGSDERRAPRRRPGAAHAVRDSVRSWPLRDRIGLARAGRRGAALIVIAGGDRRLHGRPRRSSTCDLGLLFASPRRTSTRARRGGFLDPLIGHAHPRPCWRPRSRRRSASRSRSG